MPAQMRQSTARDSYSITPRTARIAGASPSISYEPLADGTAGTIRTLDGMRDCVLGRIAPDHCGYEDPWVRQAAIQICQSGRNGDPVRGLFQFCRDQIEYIEHPFNLQVIKDCHRAIESRSGDCVTKSVCLATLLASLGYTPRFVAQCLDGREFVHVYLEVWSGGEWVGLDPTGDGKGGRPIAQVGWRQVVPDGGSELTRNIF